MSTTIANMLSNIGNSSGSLGSYTVSSLLGGSTNSEGSTVSTLISSLSNNNSRSSLLSTLARGQLEMLEISSLSKAMNNVSHAVKSAGIDEAAMESVEDAVATLQDNGVSSIKVLSFLAKVQDLAQSDPDAFAETYLDQTGEVDETTEETENT